LIGIQRIQQKTKKSASSRCLDFTRLASKLCRSPRSSFWTGSFLLGWMRSDKVCRHCRVNKIRPAWNMNKAKFRVARTIIKLFRSSGHQAPRTARVSHYPVDVLLRRAYSRITYLLFVDSSLIRFIDTKCTPTLSRASLY